MDLNQKYCDEPLKREDPREGKLQAGIATGDILAQQMLREYCKLL